MMLDSFFVIYKNLVELSLSTILALASTSSWNAQAGSVTGISLQFFSQEHNRYNKYSRMQKKSFSLGDIESICEKI